MLPCPAPSQKPNPVKLRPEPSSEVLKMASRLNPFITPFSPTPSAKVSVSASSRFLATRGNEGPRRELSYSNGSPSQDSFLTSLTPSDDPASPMTRRALACHSLQKPSKLTSLRYKEPIVFHAFSRLTKHTLMMSTESDSFVPHPGYCFYFAT